jgi:GNAT superfamily N-acetyltransferase
MHLSMRKAVRNDLEKIISLIANDPVASQREDASLPLHSNYVTAFEAISKDPNQFLMVVHDQDESHLIGTFHLTLLPSLTYLGKSRLLIEAVRVDEAYQNQHIGQWMIEQAIVFGRKRNVSMLQLTSDKQRDSAIAFYKKSGFIASHEGMKYFY